MNLFICIRYEKNQRVEGMSNKKGEYTFIEHDCNIVLKSLGPDKLVAVLEKMYQCRFFEKTAEKAYLQKKIGGFFHTYIGQEAIITAAVEACSVNNWWLQTYRCHAHALCLGVSPNEAMAELYGKETGIAKGRGGSMHFVNDFLLMGQGIVGGHLPLAAGAAFSSKYLNQDKVSLCFLGDGAVAQGTFWESLNLSALWSLPVIYVIENNIYGMGTHVERALSFSPIAENAVKPFSKRAITIDGMDFFNCYHGFKEAYDHVKKHNEPVLMEAYTNRFRGHSISDPGLYRSEKELEQAMARDPIVMLSNFLKEKNILTEAQIKEKENSAIEIVREAVEFAEKSPDPSLSSLEEGVLAPEQEGNS